LIAAGKLLTVENEPQETEKSLCGSSCESADAQAIASVPGNVLPQMEPKLLANLFRSDDRSDFPGAIVARPIRLFCKWRR
jgi:hypothetical protein